MILGINDVRFIACRKFRLVGTVSITGLARGPSWGRSSAWLHRP